MFRRGSIRYAFFNFSVSPSSGRAVVGGFHLNVVHEDHPRGRGFLPPIHGFPSDVDASLGRGLAAQGLVTGRLPNDYAVGRTAVQVAFYRDYYLPIVPYKVSLGVRDRHLYLPISFFHEGLPRPYVYVGACVVELLAFSFLLRSVFYSFPIEVDYKRGRQCYYVVSSLRVVVSSRGVGARGGRPRDRDANFPWGNALASSARSSDDLV